MLSLNELLASVGTAGIPEDPMPGREFWQLLAEPNPVFEKMIRSGIPLPEFLYTRRPGRYSAGTAGIPAILLMVLPHLSDQPDDLFDDLARTVRPWPSRRPADQYRALFDELCDRFGRTAVVERSGYSTEWIPRLRVLFPEARFVHLVRSGPDCALSMSRHAGYRTILLLREILERSGVTEFFELTEEHVRTLPPDLAPLLAERFDPALVWQRDIELTAFGQLWSRLVTEGIAHLEEVPSSMRTTLVYEQTLDDPDRELSRLAEFIGVDPLPEWLATARTMLDASRRGASRRLPPEEQHALRDSCAPGELALGLTRA
ncbi:sulfotransferase [Kitasatospora sp. LaBMicrA B282]|uniref:sulfotransferase n=1 Tax=Kitasatospora sp. LaBMicrA B282 TaxID=3420949 RepID=UPI003D0FF89F